MSTSPKPRAVIGSTWAVRKAVYAATLIAGILAVAFGLVDQATADSWAAHAGTISTALVGLIAMLGGGLATVNTGPESDEAPVGVEVPVAIPIKVKEAEEALAALYGHAEKTSRDVFSTYHPIEE